MKELVLIRRVVLLCTAILLMGSSVASTAWASHSQGHQDVTVTNKSAKLGPGGSVIISGTIECEGTYSLSTTVRQRGKGNEYNTGTGQISSGECSTSGPTTWQLTVFAGSRGGPDDPGSPGSPFHGGRISVETNAYAEYPVQIDCDAFNNCNYYYVVGDSSDVDEFKVR